jgi:hypothetical protein
MTILIPFPFYTWLASSWSSGFIPLLFLSFVAAGLFYLTKEGQTGFFLLASVAQPLPAVHGMIRTSSNPFSKTFRHATHP